MSSTSTAPQAARADSARLPGALLLGRVVGGGRPSLLVHAEAGLPA